jgi:hypothetical protein
MHGFCHMDLHGVGNETLFRPLICFASLAWQFRADGYDRGYL